MDTAIERKVMTLLTSLSACLCGEVQKRVNAGDMDALCFCGVLPGNEVPFDYASEGMAWVRVSMITPMPVETSGRVCAMEYDVTVQMGMLRCAPTIDDNGDLPDVEEMLTSTGAQHRDMGLMHQVITCCDTGIGSDPVIIDYAPVGPEGGIVGGAWSATWRVS